MVSQEYRKLNRVLEMIKKKMIENLRKNQLLNFLKFCHIE